MLQRITKQHTELLYAKSCVPVMTKTGFRAKSFLKISQIYDFHFKKFVFKKFKYNLNLQVIHTCIHPGEVSTHIKLFLTILLNVKYGVHHLPCFGRYTLSTFYWNMPHMLCNIGNMYMCNLFGSDFQL